MTMKVFLLLQFFSKTTERFVHGVDSFVDTLWKIWSDLLDVMGIDCKFTQQLLFKKKHKNEELNTFSEQSRECFSILSLCCCSFFP